MINDDRLISGGGPVPQGPVPQGPVPQGPVPVSVRRPLAAAGIDPTIIPLREDPPAPPAPHIIYINNNIPAAAAGVPASAMPAPPPAAIHHHHYNTTHQTTQRISYRIPVVRSSSALGMASLALGIIACVVCWVPWLGLIAVPVGTIGAGLGVLGVVVSLLFRKSSVGLPLTAVFVCCLAAGISIASTSSLPYWRRQLDKIITTVMPPATGSAHSASVDSSPSNSATPAPPSPLPSISNLLDSTPTPATPATPSRPATPSASPTAPKPAIADKLDPSIVAARDQLAAAEKACDQRTMQSPEYLAAVKSAADARALETQLRQGSPSSSDLMQASRDMIAADNAVTDTLTRAQANDPAVISARQALIAARAAAAH
jgi:hypothetical protein